MYIYIYMFYKPILICIRINIHAYMSIKLCALISINTCYP